MINKKGIERDLVLGIIAAIVFFLVILIVFVPAVRERLAYYISFIGDLV